MHRLQDLVRLHRLQVPVRQIAKQLGISPNTERRYRLAIAEAGLLEGDPGDLPALAVLREPVEANAEPAPQHASSVARWAKEIEGLVEDGCGPKAIFDFLRLEREGFDGSESAVKRLVARIKKRRGITEDDVAIPVLTKAGEVAQVDFGYVGKLWDPEAKCSRKAYVFVMVLGHSRRMVARLVFDQKIETWLRLHVEAFQELGGVPRIVVPDNLKAAVIRAAFTPDGVTTVNRSYRELARHFGFQVDPTPPYSPEKKGKVEAAVKYVKRSFFQARQDEVDAGVLRPQLQRWIDEVANRRTHGTTRKVPADHFEATERGRLLPLPEVAWRPVVWREAKVHRDSHVQIDRALYSVPWRWVGKQVLVRLVGNSVEVYGEDVRIATHTRVPQGQRVTRDEHLPENRRELARRDRGHWEERADALHPEIGAYVREVFDADDVHCQLRSVIAMVQHLEKHPIDRAVRAVQRARYYGLHAYGGLKNILRKGLDFEPLPNASTPVEDAVGRPRFARSVQELLDLPLEKTDAPH